MQATYKPELDSYVRNDGTQAILIRITLDRRHKRVKTGINISKKDFNTGAKNNKWVRSSNTKSNTLNAQIERSIAKLKEVENYLESNDLYVSLDRVVNPPMRKRNGNLFEYIDIHIKRYNENNQIPTAKKLLVLKNKLRDFTGIDNITFADVDYDFIKRFEIYLKSSGNKTNTIHTDLKKMRTVFNYAEKERFIDIDRNPFNHYTLKSESNVKVALSLDEITKIEKLDLSEKKRLNDCRNIFLFSFYCGGIRIGDLLTLTWKSIDDSRLNYKVRKTTRYHSIKLVNKALELIKIYKPEQTDIDKPIFPFLSKNHLTLNEKDLLQQISSKTAYINRQLKEIGMLAEIRKPISNHIARHSFATYAKDKNVDIYAIKEMLGHSNTKMTENYLKSLGNSLTDNAMDSLFNN